jgi:hypothetical protein
MKTMPAARSRTNRPRSAGSFVHGAQAEFGAVGQLDRGVDVRDTVERGHRAEHLLTVYAHVRGDAGQHRRRIVEPGPFGRGPAAQNLGALGHSVGHQVLDVFPLLFRGERADVGSVRHRVADDLGRHLLGEQPGELVVDRLVGDETLGRDAGLAVVQAARHGGNLRGPAYVGGGHDHERVAAAQFQYHLLDLAARDGGH